MASIPSAPAQPDRSRLSLDLSPAVMALLDHVSDITSVPKSQIVYGALLDQLPELVARADSIKKRQTDLLAQKGRK